MAGWTGEIRTSAQFRRDFTNPPGVPHASRYRPHPGHHPAAQARLVIRTVLLLAAQPVPPVWNGPRAGRSPSSRGAGQRDETTRPGMSGPSSFRAGTGPGVAADQGGCIGHGFMPSSGYSGQRPTAPLGNGSPPSQPLAPAVPAAASADGRDRRRSACAWWGRAARTRPMTPVVVIDWPSPIVRNKLSPSSGTREPPPWPSPPASASCTSASPSA